MTELSAITTMNYRTIAGIAIAIAITAVISIITLTLLYSGLPFFGPVNDMTNAVGGLLSALLVWQFHILLRERAPNTAIFFLLAAWIGSAAIIINSVLVAFGQMHWMTGGMYTAIGYGLIGIWLLAFHRLVGTQAFLTLGVVRVGTIAAVAMLFGLLAGPLLASGVNLANNPMVSIAYLGAATGWLLYPVWCWLVGRSILAS
jgi:hypothetical protein